MPASRTAHRARQFITGVGALIVLIGLLAGAPIALLAFAGNPLPDHLPSLAEIGTALTSRDDGQLFLRALAIVGWAGWATFALSVLVELPARMLRRPAIRLPGLSRQQRWAAVLVGSVALVLAASPAATAAGTVAATTMAAGPPAAAPAVRPATASVPGPLTGPAAMPATASGPAPRWLAASAAGDAEEPAPVYRVEKGDYLGHIAGRYLGDFDEYPELARLNEIRDPDRIRPGQLLHLPPAAEDQGVRPHATGLVAVPPPPGGWPEEGPTPPQPPIPPAAPVPVPAPSADHSTTYTVGASRATQLNELNRPLAVSAVIAAAGIVGAQIGAVLGLRRRSGGRPTLDTGRHRRLRG